MAFLRSLAHLLFMAVTVVPYTLVILAGSVLGAGRAWRYRVARAWLKLSVDAAGPLLGIRYQVSGLDNLPAGERSAAVLLVKHQSTYETFLMPAIMPNPLAYVFKKELLYIPFFGWSIGRLEMIHIDRSRGAQAFNKVVAQGRALLDKGVWVIMFPEGTRIARGQKGHYKGGGARLAIETGAPVVPIAVTSARCWPRRAFVKTPGVVQVSIGPAIASQGRKPDELMAQVAQWIEAEMHRIDPEAYPAASAAGTPAALPAPHAAAVATTADAVAATSAPSAASAPPACPALPAAGAASPTQTAGTDAVAPAPAAPAPPPPAPPGECR